MEKKLDKIITKLESIEKRLDVIETNCNSMHKHITFIDSVYTTAKMPLDLLFKSINLISGKKEYLCLPEKT